MNCARQQSVNLVEDLYGIILSMILILMNFYLKKNELIIFWVCQIVYDKDINFAQFTNLKSELSFFMIIYHTKNNI